MDRTTRPDNGAYPSQTLTSDVDLAEHAARLTTNRLRRSGRVILQEDFLSMVGWSSVLSGGSGGVAGVFSTYGGDVPFNRPGFMVLEAPASATTESAQTVKQLPLLPNLTMGFEITFKVAWDTNPPDSFRMILQRDFYSSYNLAMNLFLDFTVSPWRLYFLFGSGGGADVALSQDSNSAWHNLKCVIDFSTGFYKYLFFDDQFIDLSSYGLYSQAHSITTQKAELTVYDATPLGILGRVLVNNLILTADEY